jgi:hypothetical protein
MRRTTAPPMINAPITLAAMIAARGGTSRDKSWCPLGFRRARGYINCMSADTPEPRVDRTVLTVTDLRENDEDRYWWARTPLERLRAMEINRRMVYGYHSTPPRLQRLLEVARR